MRAAPPRAVLNSLLTFATPTVESITPNTGPAAGGTPVKIEGTGFYPGAEVTIGGSATEVHVVSDTELTATTPPGEGSAEVIVTDKGGSSTLGPSYTYEPPPCSAAPAIEEQPKDQVVTAPAPASFKAKGSTPANCEAPSVQWSSKAPGALIFTAIPGAESATYTTPPTATAESGTKFEATFTNAKGGTTTDEVTLTVNPPPCSAAPAIEEQPKDQVVTAPAPASFKAKGSTPANCEAPSVQWSSKAPGALIFTAIPGAESATYTTPPTATAESGTKFEATFTNAKGGTTTDEVTLTVNPPPCSAAPAIEEQPKDQVVTAPAPASFKAKGSTPANCEAPSVQWSSKAPGALIFTAIPGAESATYTTPPTATAESGTKFEATFTNAKGGTTTDEVTLTVNPPPCSAAPAIEEQPKDQVVTAPAPASFKAKGSTPANCEAPSVQWSSKAPGALIFTAIPGAESATYTTPPTATAESGTKFEATFTNAKGGTTTDEVTLTVNPPPCSAAPAIEEQPKDQVVTAPAPASFKAKGSTPANCEAPSVQWSSKAPGALIFTAIPGAESATYTTPPTATAESGTKFEATFTNAKGGTTTDEVTLTVNPPPCSAAPAIEEQPKDQVVTAPAPASFKAKGSTPANCEAPSVQWSSKAPGALIFTAIPGAELGHLHDAAHGHRRIGHQVRGDLHQRQRRDDDR